MKETMLERLKKGIQRLGSLEFRYKVLLGIWVVSAGCVIFSLVKQPEGIFTVIFVPAGILAIFAAFLATSTKIIEWSAPIRYVTPSEYPELHQMVDRLATKAGIPKPKVAICEMEISNAFTFGGLQRNARVCVTSKLMKTLQPDEIESVLAHEIAHIKHRDVAVIAALTLPPMICYFTGRALYFFCIVMIESQEAREESGGWAFRLAMIPVALGIWFTTLAIYIAGQLVELYASRQREFVADRASAELTQKPRCLARALFKITRDSALLQSGELRQAGGIRPFLVSDPSTAKEDLKTLKETGLDEGATTDEEIGRLAKQTKRSSFDWATELFSTHPNPVSRIRRLIGIEETGLELRPEVSKKAPAGWWWLLPVLLQWLGGLIAWNILRKENPRTAENMLTLGIALTAVLYLAGAL